MTLNRKQLLRYTGAAATGSALGAFARGLLGPDTVGTGILRPSKGWDIPPAPPAWVKARQTMIGNESFSQCGEDLVVAFMLGYLGMNEHITYLDVGANDPVKFSNTYYFYRRGNRGVLVEPNPALCRRLRETRREDTTLEAGIGVAEDKEGDYYVMTFDGLNTFSKPAAQRQVEASGGKVAIREVVKMPLLNINDVMTRHFQKAPTFLSVDTEGMDLAILQSIDFGRFRPGIICAETLVYGTRTSLQEIPEFMTTQGYVVRGGSLVNTIFVDSKRL